MPHQCVHCSRILPAGSREFLEGCKECGGKFFFYIRDDQIKEIEKTKELAIPEMKELDKSKVESDVRSILNVTDETKPVILDIESVRINGPGKYEIDVVSLLNRKPIVFKIEEGKYIIDIEGINESNHQTFKD
jgi:predicted  nucleic acid-binding Zn-ribbon protein